MPVTASITNLPGAGSGIFKTTAAVRSSSA
jgi:hypothetical protein